MSDKKGWGSTVAGWFIERDDDNAAHGAAAGESDGPGLAPNAAAEPSLASGGGYTSPSPTQGGFQTPPPQAVGGQVDFEAVFVSAGVNRLEQQPVAGTPE